MTQSAAKTTEATESITARAEREQAAYDEGLQRQTYDDVLSHCQVYWHPEVLRLFREILSTPSVSDALEVGSHGWAMVFDGDTPPPRNLRCINISNAELNVGKRKAAEQKLDIQFERMDAHALEFDDNSFDVVFGFGILHHLDYERALDEIRRVLRPGGRMIFNEPLDINPIGSFVRVATPEARTADETPLKARHLKLFKERFDVTIHAQQFLSVPSGVVSKFTMRSPHNWLMRTAFNADRSLSRIPGLRLWFRKAVIVGVKH